MEKNVREAAYRDTNELALAAYASMRGLEVVKAQRWKKERAIEYKFSFKDPEGIWDQLRIDFTNSESLKFDLAVRNLKKLCAY
jgi:hypothetical protein